MIIWMRSAKTAPCVGVILLVGCLIAGCAQIPTTMASTPATLVVETLIPPENRAPATITPTSLPLPTITSTLRPVKSTSRPTQEEDLQVESLTRHEERGCPLGYSEHKPGCDIKGNISINSGDKIYHLPGGEFYEKTVISPEYGERWFCTENEAVANGWRPPRSFK
jgi:hypothetical protein